MYTYTYTYIYTYTFIYTHTHTHTHTHTARPPGLSSRSTHGSTFSSAQPMCTMSKESLKWLASAHSLRVKETYSLNKRDVFVKQKRRIRKTIDTYSCDNTFSSAQPVCTMSKESLSLLSSAHSLDGLTNTSLLFHKYVSFVSRILFHTCERSTHVHNAKRVTYMALFSPFSACTQHDKRDELIRTKRRICETTETYSRDQRVA